MAENQPMTCALLIYSAFLYILIVPNFLIFSITFSYFMVVFNKILIILRFQVALEK